MTEPHGLEYRESKSQEKSDEEKLLYLLEKEYADRVYAAWHTGDLSYKLHEGQRPIYAQIENLKTQEALLLISRQFGKSFLTCVYAIAYCIKNPYSFVKIAAPTLKQAADIVSDNLDPICADAPKGFVRRYKSYYRWNIGTSQLRLGVLERAHVDSLRGGNAKLIICEEGGFVRSEDYQYAVTSVIGPQLLHSKGQLIHVTTPSIDPMHYIHTEVLPKCSLEGSLFRHTIYENPRLSEEQIQKAIDLCGGEDTLAFRREYLVEILRDPTRVVIPEWNNSLVLENPSFEHCFYQVSIDFGGVKDKTVALLYTYDFEKSRLVVLDERVFDRNTDSSTIMYGIKQMEEGKTIKQRHADAPGILLIDLQNKHDYYCMPTPKDDFHAGINALRVAMGQGRIFVSSRCPFTILTLSSALFNKTQNDFERTEILGHADALAALIYAWRVCDKSNPYPARQYTEWQMPARSESNTFPPTKPNLSQVAAKMLGKKR